jgi:hypothetical protein
MKVNQLVFTVLLLSVAVFQLPAQQTEADRKLLAEIRARADTGDAKAQYELGAAFLFRTFGVAKDAVEAVKWLRKAAEQNDADAQTLLGTCYVDGQGVTKDYAEAVKWFREAAEQNNAVAQYNLGVGYASGQGVAKYYAEAVKWYRKAAEQNLAYAQYNLGICYAKGDGVAKDEVEAYKWWLLAAGRGDKIAKKYMTPLENQMTREQIAEGQNLARNFKPRLAPSAEGDTSSTRIVQTRPKSCGTGFNGGTLTGAPLQGSDSSTNQGTGGGFSLAYGVKSTAGTTSGHGPTLGSASKQGRVSLSLKPEHSSTIAVNTATATHFLTSSVIDTTANPVLEFTGTDGDGDHVRHIIHISNDSSFPSSGTLVDSYSEANTDDIYYLDNTAASSYTTGISQSFTGIAGNIGVSKFYLQRFGSPTGNIVSKLYTIRGGEGGNAPDILLATSDNIDVSTLSTSQTLVSFIFSGINQYTMSAATYAITIEYPSGNREAGNYVTVGVDSTGISSGTDALEQSGFWEVDRTPTINMIFYVYTPTLSY